MKKNSTYRIGLDVGISSVGWSVLSGEKNDAILENLGVHLFESGESNNGRDRLSQERRLFRGERRIIRRRYYRKERLKAHLENIGFVTKEEIDSFYLEKSTNIYELKMKAIKEEISPKELLACLLHVCNHRGYRSFYETEDLTESNIEDYETEELETQEDKTEEENKKNEQYVKNFAHLYSESKCETISEFICTKCIDKETRQPYFKNVDSRQEHWLIAREFVEEEVNKILFAQMKYHKKLTLDVVEMCKKIIFSQRDFEEGPGNINEKFRQYSGFLDSVGYCPFYKEELRGFRATPLGDIYAVINKLSQNNYRNIITGSYELPKKAAEEIIKVVINEAKINKTMIKNVFKKYNVEMLENGDIDDKKYSDLLKFIPKVKKTIELNGGNWEDYCNEEQFDIYKPSKLFILAEILSKNITPKRRRNALKSLSFIDETLVKSLMTLKAGGTSRVSYHFMCDAIDAFMNGEVYGVFQAERIKRDEETNKTLGEKLPAEILLNDPDIKKNPVVLRAINETRKIVNAIINHYGSPEYINIEVASDLNRSYTERKKIKDAQGKNEKAKDKIKKELTKKYGEKYATETNIEKYRLYKEQDGLCVYSGQKLGLLDQVIYSNPMDYEIDHIVPQSLILDNTLNNKALVYASENQRKGQRTPLMYITDKIEQCEFIKRVNHMRSSKSNEISAKKYGYYMLKSIYGEEAHEILQAWKSRNINDTRYITRYIVSMLKNNLKFAGSSKSNVYGIKGALTSKFRRYWLNRDTWGGEKDRNGNLHHAVDAVVIANLVPAYVELASNAIRLNQLSRRGSNTREYESLLDTCLGNMKKYYGFEESYTKLLLSNDRAIPAFLSKIREEVDIRMNISDKEKFDSDIKEFYGNRLKEFIIPPHQIMITYKQERKFKGAVADSNPIKLREVEGEFVKIKRKKIEDLEAKDIDNIYTNDSRLKVELREILTEDGIKTIKDYMEKYSVNPFRTSYGQRIYKVSINEGKVSSYYKKEISDNNYSIMGMPKYYCIDIYKDKNKKTKTFGVRFVDLIKKDKKLFIRENALPKDYDTHIHYLYKGDYLELYDKNGTLIFSGNYYSVKTVQRSKFYFKEVNKTASVEVNIGQNTSIIKYHIDLLGNKGGEIKCSEPLLSVKEKKSKSKTIGLWSWKEKGSTKFQ